MFGRLLDLICDCWLLMVACGLGLYLIALGFVWRVAC